MPSDWESELRAWQKVITYYHHIYDSCHLWADCLTRIGSGL